MAKVDPQVEQHKAWLGLVQPVGLVVSPPALTKAGLVLDRNVIEAQQALQAIVTESDDDDARGPALLDFPRFATGVLAWNATDLAGAPGAPPVPDHLAVPLPDHGETLRPTYAAIDEMDSGKVLLLVQIIDRGSGLDKLPAEDHRTGWHATPQARFERLLHDTKVAAGLLLDGDELRLVYAPEGESSGYMSFPIAEMCTVQGRPLLAAVHMLLSEHRVFGAPDKQRLLDLLAESRKYQNEVSTKLASQVLSALWELLRGFQAADEAARGTLLFDIPREDPQQIYGGLLTVIMRLVFLLYSEDQGLMPDEPIYARNYAIGGLFERLREDAGRYPDTMDQRFGAYAALLSTFRMVFDGGAHGAFKLPTRHGQLFNPDEYSFLEGRPSSGRVMGFPIEVPRVPDGVVWRVLDALLMLEGERLSYRALDVEQIGSVYESMMGFDVRVLPGRAIAVRPKNIIVDLDALLALEAGKRDGALKEQAECELTDKGKKALKDARTVDDLVAALGTRVSPQTPRWLSPGAMFLQPGEERRRSGSHYTPRELTEPIVRTTLRPVLEALGPKPTPAQILELKVCDPAMGSGAFLVEACRQLAVALVAAWDAHGSMPALPPDEPAYLHARRLVAQRCLYGVDKNPFAVSLAKLSLWLVTLAKDHAFTFLDHALKHGDSLVGLTKNQIGAFHWDPPEVVDSGPLFKGVSADIQAVAGWRAKIQALGEGDYDARRQAWLEAEEVVREVRLIGDLCIAAYFDAETDASREAQRLAYEHHVSLWKANGDRATPEQVVHTLRSAEPPVVPFHWEIEFPEVFGRTNPGFDAIVGNPPFAGSVTLADLSPDHYTDWLRDRFAGAGGKADLVAFFFRRTYDLLRVKTTLGLIATNTVAQGDTRVSGLLQIRRAGGHIYSARRRIAWPGQAAIIVSVVHIAKQMHFASAELDNKSVERITAFLLPVGPDENPHRLKASSQIAFLGAKPGSKALVFGQRRDNLPLADADAFLADPRLRDVVRPYVGGSELNDSADLLHQRWIVDFGTRSLEELRPYQAIADVVYAKTPARERAGTWWQFARRAADLHDRLRNATTSRVIVISEVCTSFAFAFQDAAQVFSNTVYVFVAGTAAAYCCVQSRVHEVWARVFSSSLKDDLRYVGADCFDTFPLPVNWTSNRAMEAAGHEYYAHRSKVMLTRNTGLTAVYGRFHDPDDASAEILELRRLHAAMDRAVLDAYGWHDVPTDCDFLLDYEIDEETWGNKKKPWRYRWPDAVHDDVLARLLVLNQQRYDAEVAAGLHGDKARPTEVAGAEAEVDEAKPARKPRKAAAKATDAVASTKPKTSKKSKGRAEQPALFGTPEKEHE